MPSIAAITGGTGFLGQHLIKALTREGWQLRLLVRRMPDLGTAVDPDMAPVQLVLGSLEDPAALRELVQGADTIVHVAGAIKAKSRADFMAANAEGTARVLQARADAAPDASFVMMSSLAAREAEISHYAASKAAGEAHVRAASGDWAILRPCAIYGPGDRETLTVFKAARLPVHPMLNGPDARVCLMNVSDVTSAVLAVLEGNTWGGTFELSDARHDGYAWREIIATACAATGTRPRPFRVPEAVVRTLGRAGDLATAVTGSAEMLTSQKVREILHPDWSSPATAQLDTGTWRPMVDLDQGFADAVAWYRAAGWL